MSPAVYATLAILTGLAVGVLSGVMGIGGGILLVPIMVLGFGFTQHVAQGTSLAAIVPTAIVGAYTHDRAHNVDRGAAIWLSVGGLAGALLGALVAVQLPRELLVRLFGALLLYSAYRIWAGRRPRPAG
ncbi:MAG: sulfite exporter TauE/SafE family protein [Candidatus Dormibacteraeota bacterium]|nr:sulfite exporter TauE/SafE family protein [Candidatus Dormibacteraeota bacterium]